MQRYFIPRDQFQPHQVVILGDDAHHLIRVMRAQVGDSFICSDGEGQEALVKIDHLSNNTVTASIVERLEESNEAGVQVTIAQSLPKGDKIDLVIQKCTEIGAHRFIPFISQRTVVQLDAKKEHKRQQRWQKIAKEAAEQSHRSRIPLLDPVITWKQLLAQVGAFDLAMICYEKEEGTHIGDLLKVVELNELVHKSVLLIVGPEGGFTPEEVTAAEAAGARAVGLGRRILRTETAALVGLTCIHYQFGEMGGT